MASTVMKVEIEGANNDSCVSCGTGGDVAELLLPEEYDANASTHIPPLRTILLHLSNNKVLPEGRFCTSCIQRAIDAYDFSTNLTNQSAPPLSEKIRALRKRLHELTQKIDVFIVVGGGGANGTGTYVEEDIIMVEREALAAAAAADEEDQDRAQNARGDAVYQCSVCPMSYQRSADFRAHMETHPPDAVHSCWTCGVQCESRQALKAHQSQHHATAFSCHLCNFQAETQLDLSRHTCESRCPVCETTYPSRVALSSHVTLSHGDAVCPVCYQTFETEEELTAHALTHRQNKHFVCGYDGCILRFASRTSLLTHIRKCHGGAPSPATATAATVAAVSCPHPDCDRTFATTAAMKRHARVHQNTPMETQEETTVEYLETVEGEEVEYLEMEELEYDEDVKPQI